MFATEYGITIGYNENTQMLYYTGEFKTSNKISKSAKKIIVDALKDTKTGRDALKAYGLLTFGYDLVKQNGAPGKELYGSSAKTLDPGQFLKYNSTQIDLADFDSNGNAFYAKFQGVPERAFNLARIFEHEWIGHGIQNKSDGSSMTYARNPGGAVSVVNTFRREIGLPLRLNYGLPNNGGIIIFGNSKADLINGIKSIQSGNKKGVKFIQPSIIKNP